MDIKLKNKLKNVALIISVFLIGLSLLSIFDLVKNRDYLKENYYFNSKAFIYSASSDFALFSGIFTQYKNYPINPSDYKFTEEEIKTKMISYDSDQEDRLWSQYSQSIQQAAGSGDSDRVLSLIKERDNALKELEKKNTISEDEAKNEIIKEKNKAYEAYKTVVLTSQENIKYYFTDKITKAVYTNLENIQDISDYIKNNALYSVKFPSDLSNNNFRSISNIIYDSNLEGYFIIPQDTNSLSNIISDYNYYNSIRKRLREEICILAVSAAVLVFLLIFIYKNRDDNDFVINVERKHRRIPLDLRIILFIISFVIAESFIKGTAFFSFPVRLSQIFTIFVSALYSLYLIIIIIDLKNYFNDPASILKDIRNSCIMRFKVSFKDCLGYKGMLVKSAFLAFITILTGIFINMIGWRMQYYPRAIWLLFTCAILFLYFITVFSYIITKLGYLSIIIRGTSQMVSGNLAYSIEEKRKGILGLLAHNINNLEQGYKKTLEDKVKSERLKSELITNVSHDLKTPLTSIINYINFLKSDNVNDEDKKAYLDILDRKSQRLKTLIEDLFEASKMASGSVKLELQQVNLTELLKQTLGEYNEKIKNSSLTFKVNGDNQNIILNLDGKKTWRVFDNLINNALKYSQPNTRVYIDISEDENKASVIIKNISAYELDFNPEEIFERFKRGDKSRNTEGSGLGLDIAKSIVELQGGKLGIEIDGDLFKAVVEFYKK